MSIGDSDVAERVRLLKVSAGLRDIDVARALSMSRAAVQARMTARTSWKPPELTAVAQLLGTTVAELFGESIGPAVVMLEVRDVVGLSQWYSEKLRVRLRELRAPRYAELESELGSRFMLYMGEPLPDTSGLTLYLQVRDVDTAYKAARARGVSFMRPPQDRRWGARRATLRDPAGHTVSLMTVNAG